jgi:hypothetical protein
MDGFGGGWRGPPGQAVKPGYYGEANVSGKSAVPTGSAKRANKFFR